MPFLRRGAKPGGDWVVHHVAADACLFLVITNPVVERLGLPECLASALQALVGFVCRVAFPGLQDPAEQVVGPGPEHRVNVVGHDHPSGEQVTLTVEVTDGVGYQLGNVGSPQPAGTHPAIQVTFHLPMIVPLDVLLRVWHRVCRPAVRILSGGQEAAQPLSALGLKPQQHFLGQRVVQAESDEVGSALTFYMRQVPARVYSASLGVGFFGFDPRRPQRKPNAVKSGIGLVFWHMKSIAGAAPMASRPQSAEPERQLSSRQALEWTEAPVVFAPCGLDSPRYGRQECLRYATAPPSAVAQTVSLPFRRLPSRLAVKPARAKAILRPSGVDSPHCGRQRWLRPTTPPHQRLARGRGVG